LLETIEGSVNFYLNLLGIEYMKITFIKKERVGTGSKVKIK